MAYFGVVCSAPLQVSNIKVTHHEQMHHITKYLILYSVMTIEEQDIPAQAEGVNLPSFPLFVLFTPSVASMRPVHTGEDDLLPPI